MRRPLIFMIILFYSGISSYLCIPHQDRFATDKHIERKSFDIARNARVVNRSSRRPRMIIDVPRGRMRRMPKIIRRERKRSRSINTSL